MKRIICALLILYMLFVTVACNNAPPEIEPEQDSVVGDEYLVVENDGELIENDDRTRSLYEAQLADDIKMMILEDDMVEICIVVLSLGEDSLFTTSVDEPSVAITLTLIGYEMLSTMQVQAIADIVRGSIRDIKDENIRIIDNNKIRYFVGANAAETLRGMSDSGLDDNYFDFLFFDSVKEASGYAPFPILMPSILPENTRLYLIGVAPGRPLSRNLIRSASVEYKIEIDDDERLSESQKQFAFIILQQSDLLDYKPDLFSELYDSAIRFFEAEGGNTFESIRTTIGGKEAVINGYWLPEFLESAEPSDDYAVNVSLHWHNDGMLYSLTAFTPSGVIDYDMFISIAESIK